MTPPVMMPASLQERRVRRLLRWYPRSWRDRYGEEFAELLLAELADQPRDWRRTANVAVSGLFARCTWAGLTSHELGPAEQARVGLATLGCALAAVLGLGVAMLAQLATGWQWASSSPAIAAGTLAMAAAAAGLIVIGAAALAPYAWAAAVALRRRDGRVVRPACLALACAVVLATGARHFENAWPGTGGTGAQHGLVPGGLAAFGWASTLSVSSYWAHPALLSRFPAPELAWMALSPLALLGLLAGLVLVVRRLTLPRRLVRFQAGLATGACAAGVVFVVGAANWVLGQGRGVTGLFRPGLVDSAELMIMALALAVACRAAAGVRRAGGRSRASGT